MKSKLWVAALAAALISAPAAQAQHSQHAGQDLVETAVAAGQFTTLVTAVQAAGLVETLQGDGPFTVFAPTDAAFAKLPAGALEGLLANPDQLRAVLLYHVVPGRVTAAQVTGLESATTAQGSAVPVRVREGRVSVGGAEVVQADVQASNGVIHVIDAVLLPPQGR
jgi:uncharacterized surface protein with fasciclin (FAS1) repeats